MKPSLIRIKARISIDRPFARATLRERGRNLGLNSKERKVALHHARRKLFNPPRASANRITTEEYSSQVLLKEDQLASLGLSVDRDSTGTKRRTADDPFSAQRPFKVFISYASEEEELANRLAADLQGHGIDAWIDSENLLLPGDDLHPAFAAAIQEADIFLACFSPSYSEKYDVSWVKKELEIALEDERRTGCLKAIPVRLKRGGNVPTGLGSRAFADLSREKNRERTLDRLIEAIRLHGESNRQTEQETG